MNCTSVSKLLLSMVFCATWTGNVFGDLKISYADVRSDRLPIAMDEWQFQDGWSLGDQYFPRHYKPGAYVHILVQNTGTQRVTIDEIRLDDRNLDDLRLTHTREGSVIWYRANPQEIPSGKLSWITIRLRDVPENPLTISLAPKGGKPVSCQVKTDEQDLRMGYVGFGGDRKTLHVYASNFGRFRV